MPRYFFDVCDGHRTTRDIEGIDVPDLDALRFEAINALPDLLRDQLPNGDSIRFSVRVRDVDDRPVFEASLNMTVRWI